MVDMNAFKAELLRKARGYLDYAHIAPTVNERITYVRKANWTIQHYMELSRDKSKNA